MRNHAIRTAASAAILTAFGQPLIACGQELPRDAAQTAAVVKVGPKGVSIGSPDEANVVKLRGTLHFDGRRFLDSGMPDAGKTFILRRARPTLEGTFDGIYDFRLMPDFGGGRAIIVDAYVVARLKPWLRFTAGKFKAPVGLERLQSSNDLRFIERGLPTDLVPNRDLGVSIDGEVAAGRLSYSIGYFNGVIDGGSSNDDAQPDIDNDDQGDWTARIFAHPFSRTGRVALHGLGIGIAATYGQTQGSEANALLPSYRTPGQETFFSYRGTDASDVTAAASGTFADGERLRIAPQLYYCLGRFGALGEYVRVAQEVSRNTPTAALRSDRLVHSAWQLQLSWSVTGERESFGGFTPRRTFSLDDGTLGAFELVARVHQLDVDDGAFTGGIDSFADPTAAAARARAYGVGLNWYLNQNFKWQLNYDVTRFDGGAASGDRDDEQALFTRFAAGF